MNFKKITAALFSTLLFTQVFCQNTSESDKAYYKFSVSTTYLSFANFGQEKTNTHHYEFHLKYQFSQKTKLVSK